MLIISSVISSVCAVLERAKINYPSEKTVKKDEFNYYYSDWGRLQLI